MREVDDAIKKISSWHADCMLSLFYGKEHDIKLLGVEDAQIQIPEHRADKVWRVKDNDAEACLMLEAIAEPDRRDFSRILLKNAAARVALKMPVITVLVYIQRGKYATFPDGFEERIGALGNKVTFARILLWENKDRILSGELKELAPFLPLFEDDPDPEILRIENEIIDTMPDLEERMELKTLGGILAARKFSEDIIRQYLHLEADMINETTIFSEWLDQKYREGKRAGMREGENTGENIGRLNEARTLLGKQLSMKFGGLHLDLKHALESLRLEQLDALAIALFGFHSVDDLKTWLEKNENALPQD